MCFWDWWNWKLYVSYRRIYFHHFGVSFAVGTCLFSMGGQFWDRLILSWTRRQLCQMAGWLRKTNCEKLNPYFLIYLYVFDNDCSLNLQMQIYYANTHSLSTKNTFDTTWLTHFFRGFEDTYFKKVENCFSRTRHTYREIFFSLTYLQFR
jgi:hypothetical protein